jgi:hypothetical protein
MTRPLIQIDDEVREMNNKEFAEYQARLAETATKEAEAQAKAIAKAALLERLGITADEAALLLS